MRTDISVHPWAKWFMPYLNGEELHHCRMADEELGCAEVYETIVGRDGREYRLMSTRMVFGEIEIRPLIEYAHEIKAEPERVQEIWDESLRRLQEKLNADQE